MINVDKQAPGSKRRAVIQAAGLVLIMGMEAAMIILVFPLVLLAAFTWPAQFGHMGWQTCFSWSVFAAVCGVVFAVLRNWVFFPNGRSDKFRTGNWLIRELDALSVRFLCLAITLVVAGQKFPIFLLFSLCISIVLGVITAILTRAWVPMPDAATLAARRDAIIARRNGQNPPG